MTDASKKLVAEYSFLAAAILLESFLSDLVVAYINSDSRRFREYLRKSMRVTTSDKATDQAKEHAASARDLAVIELPHPTVAQIRSILDSRDFNITFETVGDMKASAGKWLPNNGKRCFQGLTKHQSAVLVATKRVRNHLAHRSQTSKNKMQTALADPDLPSSLKRGPRMITDVGSFLLARPTPQSDPRLVSYFASLDSIAHTLCP